MRRNWFTKSYSFMNSARAFFALLIVLLFIASALISEDNQGYRSSNLPEAKKHRDLQLMAQQGSFVNGVKTWLPQECEEGNPDFCAAAFLCEIKANSEVKKDCTYDSLLAGKIQLYISALLRFDYIFPVAYALLAMVMIALLSRPFGPRPGIFTLIAFSLPFFAALFDLVENTLHIIFLSGVTSFEKLNDINPTMVAVAASFARTKWALLLITIAIIAFLVIRNIIRLLSRSRK